MSTVSAPSQGYLDITTFPNKFNAVIPQEAPFYRTGLKLVDDATGRVLIEGLDYYLGYYFKSAAEVYKDAIYGGFILLTVSRVRYTIVSVSRDYRVPISEIGKWLVGNNLKDPRNVDWAEVMRYAPTIPAIDPPKNIEEAMLRDEVVAAINTLAVRIKSREAEMEHALESMAALLHRAADKVFSNGEYQHHYGADQHSYVASDIGALAVGAAAVNSVRAYGRTIDELRTVMSTAGIQQRDIDRLLNVVAGEFFGRIHSMDGNGLVFKTANDNHVITLKDGVFSLSTKLAMEFTSDRENNVTGANQIDAGLNSLVIHPDGGVKAPVYNGTFLITPDMVNLYVFGAIKQTTTAYFRDGTTTRFVGNGKEFSKLTINAVPPQGTPSGYGLVCISSVPSSLAQPNTVLSQKAVNDIYLQISSYVDTNFTVNGRNFDANQDLSLTKGDFGLSAVNNTAPADKPVTTAIINALASKALLNHSHTVADVNNVPTADDNTPGLLMLHNAIDSTVQAALTSAQGYALQQRIMALEGKAGSLLPASSLNNYYVGNDNQEFVEIPCTFAGNILTIPGPLEISNGAGKKVITNQTVAAPTYGNGKYYLINYPITATAPVRLLFSFSLATLGGSRYGSALLGEIQMANGVITSAKLYTSNDIGKITAVSQHSALSNAHGLSRKLEFDRSPLKRIRHGCLDVLDSNEPVRYATRQHPSLPTNSGLKTVTTANHTLSIGRQIYPWYSDLNFVDKWWKVGSHQKLDPATGWPAAATYDIVALQPPYAPAEMVGGESFGVKFKLTTSKSKVRIRAWADDMLSIYIDGVTMAEDAPFPYSGNTFVDYEIAPGLHTFGLSVKQGINNGGSPVWMGFIIYDYDPATDTATELRRSQMTDKVGMIVRVSPEHKYAAVEGVYRADPIPGSVTDVVRVTDTRTGKPLQHTVEQNSVDGSKIDVYYAKAFYPGIATSTYVVQEVSVNVMKGDVFG